MLREVVHVTERTAGRIRRNGPCLGRLCVNIAQCYFPACTVIFFKLACLITSITRSNKLYAVLILITDTVHRISQLIGSTLALQYMRAGKSSVYNSYTNVTHLCSEYVAPLGSTSLIFNFLFAKFLVNTPVTNHDIYVRSLPISPCPFSSYVP